MRKRTRVEDRLASLTALIENPTVAESKRELRRALEAAEGRYQIGSQNLEFVLSGNLRRSRRQQMNGTLPDGPFSRHLQPIGRTIGKMNENCVCVVCCCVGNAA